MSWYFIQKNYEIILKARETNTYSKQIFYWKDFIQKYIFLKLDSFLKKLYVNFLFPFCPPKYMHVQ